MKKICKVTLLTHRLTACITLCAAMLFFSTGCNWIHNVFNPKSGEKPFISNDTLGLILWAKPGTDNANLRKLVDSIKGLPGGITDSVSCQSCDNTLMLLKGPGAQFYIQHQTASGGGGAKGAPGASGEDGGVYYSYNFQFNFADTIGQFDTIPKAAKISKVQTAANLITVAVFDTGIDSAYIDYHNYFYTSNDQSCLGPSANNGWNFTVPNGSSLWQDDDKQKHGTIVSQLIVNQVNTFNNGTGIKLLPVKIADKTGKGDLFHVLCGLSYAVNRGAKIINASFGYYVPDNMKIGSGPDPYSALFKEYVKTYLTGNNILLIAAAGNNMPGQPDRNLDTNPFYPASFGGDPELPNVITITTVKESSGTAATVSPMQNYSPVSVSIGVNADAILPNNDYVFLNPLFQVAFGPQRTVKGSSFATPIATGQICGIYGLLSATGAAINRAAIINGLNGIGMHDNAALISFIAGKHVITKH